LNEDKMGGKYRTHGGDSKYCKILVRNPEEKRPLVRTRCR